MNFSKSNEAVLPAQHHQTKRQSHYVIYITHYIILQSKECVAAVNNIS